MEDMESRIAEILNDPEKLGQVMDIAKGLGLSPPESASVPAGETPAIAPDDRQTALLRALTPYLRPDRRRRLQRALEMAKLSQLAQIALQSRNMTEGQVEDEHV